MSTSTSTSSRARTSAPLILIAVALVGCTTDPSQPASTAAQTSPASAGSASPAAMDPVPLPRTEELLEPGRYLLSLPDAPSAPLVPVLTVPAGYLPVTDGSGVRAEETFPAVVWVWNIESVHTHPCDSSGRPEPVGPSVADLANALAAQPLRDATAPVTVTVGGYEGLFVELSMPDDVDVDACPGGRFNSWPGRWQEGPTEVDLLWMVDVEGQRLAFDLSYDATAGHALVDELREIVETATFAASTPR